MKISIFIIGLLLTSNALISQNTVGNTYFGFDVSILTNQNKLALDVLIPQLKGNKIKLKGYTDFIGTNTYNDELSNKRVNSVKQYLLSKGIQDSNIKETIGMGELTEFNDRAKNRRVDVLIEKQEVVAVVKEAKVKVEVETKVDNSALSAEKVTSLNVGESIAVEGMEFIPGRHFLQEYSKPILDNLLVILSDNSKLKVEIQGHICCDHSGTDGLDWDTQTKNLSFNRAKHIYERLVKNGIAKNRLSYKGFGSTKPLVEEITKADQQKNRRVEIMILEK